jgi:hypothetical protein
MGDLKYVWGNKKYNILVGNTYGNRPLGRLRNRWKDNIKIVEKQCVKTWTEFKGSCLSQMRNFCDQNVETSGFIKGGSFLTSSMSACQGYHAVIREADEWISERWALSSSVVLLVRHKFRFHSRCGSSDLWCFQNLSQVWYQIRVLVGYWLSWKRFGVVFFESFKVKRKQRYLFSRKPQDIPPVTRESNPPRILLQDRNPKISTTTFFMECIRICKKRMLR